MNAAYIHLALNNFPPILNLAAMVILFVGVIRQSVPIIRTGLVLLLCAVAFAVPTFYTGEGAEDIVEDLQGVNERAIHPHEEAGELTLIVFIVEGVAALAALVVGARRALPRWLPIVVLLISVVTTITVFRTAYLGGKIHHPETEMRR